MERGARKLLTAHAGDAMPDAFQLGNTWIPEFVALRAIEPLDPQLRDWPEAALADYFPGILATNRLAGQIFAPPWYVDTRLFFYRSDLLAAAGFPEPPVTWDGWLRAMAALKAQGGEKHYAILLPIDEWQLPVISRPATRRHPAARPRSIRQLSGPALSRCLYLLSEPVRAGLAPPVGNSQMANLYQEFASGTFAIYVSGPWNIGEFGRRLPAALQPHWSTAPLPDFADASLPSPGERSGARAVGVSLAAAPAWRSAATRPGGKQPGCYWSSWPNRNSRRASTN